MRKELIMMAAANIVAAQIRMGVTHPSPPLIAQAVDIAEALAAELDKREASADVPEAAPTPPAKGQAAPTPPAKGQGAPVPPPP